jgi:hypothetical protein
MEIQILDSLRDICAVLNKHDVEYMLIGGIAVGFYGFPRATADIDFWYNPSISNFHKIVSALDEFGVDTTSLKELVFDPKKTFIRVPHVGFNTEFLPFIQGLDTFNKAKLNAYKTDVSGVPVLVLGLTDLLKNTESLSRDVDLRDVEELRKRNRTI